MVNSKSTTIIAASVVIILFLDFLYISLLGKNHFSKLINSIQGSPMTVKKAPVVFCYFLMILGLNFFILSPRRSVGAAFILGIVIYGIYETVNYAIIKDWTLSTVFMDTLWGGILFSVTTWVIYYAYDRRALEKTI